MKNVKNKIKEHFLQNPTVRLRVRQLERETGAHLPSVIRYVKELEKEEIIKRNVISGITFYTAHRASEQYLLEKKLYNIMRLHESGLVRHLTDQFRGVPIILFGSYEKGEDTEDSDIDIFIEHKKKGIKGLDAFEKRLGRGIQVFMQDSIRKVRNKDLANNIINGTKLEGFLEVL